nr:ulp1 protease family, C-terminal catalytic domain-containing protein [Tanacetum cinerariifolium]
MFADINKSSAEYTKDNSNDEDNEDSNLAEEEQNNEDSDSVKTPPVKKRGRPKKLSGIMRIKCHLLKDEDVQGKTMMNRKSKQLVQKEKEKNTKTTPTTLFNAMAILNVDRKKCLYEMGFGSLIGMAIHELPGMLGFYVIDNLDTKTNLLSLTDNFILVNSQLVHDILGIPMGGCSLESLESRSADDPFIKEWFSQFGDKNEVRPNDITDVIVSINDAGKLFKMNFLMLFANTMGLCETSGVCNMNIVKKIRDDVCIEKIDWCSYIITCLKESKQKWVNPATHHYTGPLTFMILLYLHCTKFDDFDVTRQIPAIKHWKSVQMKHREKLEIEKYGRFGMLPKKEAINLQSENKERNEEVHHILNKDDKVDDSCLAAKVCSVIEEDEVKLSEVEDLEKEKQQIGNEDDRVVDDSDTTIPDSVTEGKGVKF